MPGLSGLAARATSVNATLSLLEGARASTVGNGVSCLLIALTSEPSGLSILTCCKMLRAPCVSRCGTNTR